MNSKVIRRALDVCWILLCVYFVFKVCGATWLSALPCSDYLNTHLWVTVVCASCSSYILFSIYYLAICKKIHFEWWIHLVLFPYFIAMTALKVYVIPTSWHIVVDLLSNFVVPYLLLYKYFGISFIHDRRLYMRPIIAFVLNYGFQAISVTIRSVVVDITVTNIIVRFLLSFDVLIMLVLYWLYTLLDEGGEME